MFESVPISFHSDSLPIPSTPFESISFTRLPSRSKRMPDWVVRTLESNSALPDAVPGSRGGTGGDAWRDESDEDDDDGQEPLEEVIS